MTTRRGYAQAARRRKRDATMPAQPSMVRKAGEAAAKKVYKTLNPAVKATTGAMVKGLGAYAAGTNALANQISKRLPKGTPTRGTRGPRRRMAK